MALIAVVLIAFVTSLGDRVGLIYRDIVTQISGPSEPADGPRREYFEPTEGDGCILPDRAKWYPDDSRIHFPYFSIVVFDHETSPIYGGETPLIFEWPDSHGVTATVPMTSYSVDVYSIRGDKYLWFDLYNYEFVKNVKITDPNDQGNRAKERVTIAGSCESIRFH